ncbi:MAG: tRNA 2-thiocytidine biosynthesis protein TtcA [Synergistaceae bacterium]|nr:tRNA 2-thiocytidine biosynthesis protein TtcA [Synergistaceae bacterium]
MKDYELSHSLRRSIGKALSDYNMIEQGDRVLAALSGGKDSLLLLHALNLFKAHSPVKFNLAALTVKINDEMNTAALEDYCRLNEIDYYVHIQPIIEIINLRQEKSPCSFCANMRRGILSNWAASNGFNKLALGHTMDDAVETFFLNLFHTGRSQSFMPVAFMSRAGIHVIRPLVLSTEAMIIDEVKRLELPVMKSTCPFAGDTHRTKIRGIVADLRKNYVPDLYAKIIHALNWESK